jgi:hypothetical protein
MSFQYAVQSDGWEYEILYEDIHKFVTSMCVFKSQQWEQHNLEVIYNKFQTAIQKWDDITLHVLFLDI